VTGGRVAANRMPLVSVAVLDSNGNQRPVRFVLWTVTPCWAWSSSGTTASPLTP